MHISSVARWSVMALAAAPFMVACGDQDRMDLPADAGKTLDAPAPIPDASLPDEEVGADTTLPEHLDLGAVSCGTTATTSFELPNRGPAPLTYSFSGLPRDASMSPSEGIVAPGAAQTIVVTARVSERAAARTAFAATIMMTSNARQGHVLSIPMTFRAQGATIVMPSQISLGDTPVQTAVSRTFTVRNDGDVAAQVEIPLPSGELSVQLGAGGGPVTIEPGGSVTGEARYLPTNLGVDSALPGVAIAGPTCGEQPVLILLSGQGVPRGGVVVDAGPIDFGDATCGVAAPAQSIQLTNPATNDATFTAEVRATTATNRVFHVSPSSGIVPAGGSATLTVTSDAIAGPAQGHVYTASLRVITQLDTSTAHSVPIRMNLPAAELFIAANAGDIDKPFDATADLGFVPVGTTAVTAFAVLNTGNKVATLIPSLTTPFHITAPATIAPGEFVDGTIEYTAASLGPVTALSNFAIGDACAHPITLELHAGVGAAAIIEPATATTTSPAPATVSAPLRITNSGNAPLHLKCAESGTRGALQLAPEELTIPAGATDAFTVTMVAGSNATGVVQRDIGCRTNEVLHETRDTTMTLTVVPAE
jgi:HYDIN/CFA65/VesB-like, Ig-like domain